MNAAKPPVIKFMCLTFCNENEGRFESEIQLKFKYCEVKLLEVKIKRYQSVRIYYANLLFSLVFLILQVISNKSPDDD